MLGTIAFQTQRNREAKELLERAFVLAPDDLAIRTLLAELELKRGDAARARQLLEPVVRDPALAKAGAPVGLFVTLSEACRMLGAIDDALIAIDAGMRSLPAAPELYRQRGLLLLTAGRFADALPSLESYQRLQPENPRSALFLGQAYASVGRIDDARRVLAQGEQLAVRAGQAATAQHCREMLQQLAR